MDISVTKTGADAYTLRLGTEHLTLDGRGLKALLLQITQVLMPGAAASAQAAIKAGDFMGRLRGASDKGLQALMLAVQHDDVLVLLKAAERDPDLRDRLYANMSERSRKMCVEDMLFKFRDGVVPEGSFDAAMARLNQAARRLEAEGALTYER
jgi:hypothetical protein